MVSMPLAGKPILSTRDMYTSASRSWSFLARYIFIIAQASQDDLVGEIA
jgi:hypothetical protein